MTPQPGSDRPVLRVVAGDATPEEIAAVVAAVTATSAAAVATVAADGRPAATGAASVWSAPGYAHRNWRTSFWPR